MSLIQVKHLSFGYDESYEEIFHDVSFHFDTEMKTALIGRNARGKTTFLKLLADVYKYQGDIIKSVECFYFPYSIENQKLSTIDLCFEIEPSLRQWQLEKELRCLKMEPYDILYRSFDTLSKGEQTKVLFAVLFLKERAYLLIDEPTNHLDQETRKIIAEYLMRQKGFLLVSHDRAFIDACCDHIIAMNPARIDVVSGTFSSWYADKQKEDAREITKNEKLKKDINRLDNSRKQTEHWSNQVEKSKQGAADKGYVGHMAAKMMKRSKSIEKRQIKVIEEKKSVLKNIEEYDDLKIHPLHYFQSNLITFSHVSFCYGKKKVFQDLSFSICQGERILLKGRNGCGKSSVIACIMNNAIQYYGDIHRGSRLKISYVPQDCSDIHGTLDGIIGQYHVDGTLVKTILHKLGFSRIHFHIPLQNLSEGQKKKVMLAISLATPAHLYIWDEPLNYIDIYSRIQIEDLILKYQPTILFVEHDQFFQNKIATKVIDFHQLV